ncbi:antibiotic biosynthesis monooxygenase family protein [Peristeroidobacter agariperforans]|uniref:antibiotic biosynthesis monooxygenase family protein n=1 Tax=Peristeroidobacter agariperforans TaxID=268404 RepID=UPI00101B7A15|nr:antibiotic biosynthesis monooxygenase [Peristeroidobacter agariperforans]
MIAVIFEVAPAPGQMNAYLDTAAKLRPLLEGIDGFISIERFQSLSDSGRILSLSFWRDEAAIRQWRNMPPHRTAQSAGREAIFADYRLRVAAVVRDYGMNDRDEAPEDSRGSSALRSAPV